MNDLAILDQLRLILREAIAYDGPLSVEMTVLAFENWDSAGAMHVVAMIEHHFAIRIPALVIPRLDTIQKIIDFVRLRTAGVPPVERGSFRAI